MKTQLVESLASKVDARLRCIEAGNAEWEVRHKENADKLVRDYLPRGSGFDSGTTLDWDASRSNKIVFRTSFHHMDEHGYYDGWTEHVVTVRPSFIGRFSLKINGRDRNGIKDYIADGFHHALSQEVDQ
jgi:hypothetical protein